MITILLNPDEEKYLLFEAKDKDEILGTLKAEFESDRLVVNKIDCEKFVLDGLCRTALNYALNRSYLICEFSVEDNDVFNELKKLGFVQNNNNIIKDIDNFFTLNKNCTKL